MKPIPPGTRCALSNQEIKPDGPYFATSGEFLPKSDPLHKFCGKAMHWDAYAQWPERPRFARAYVEAWVNANRRNPFWWQVHLDDDIYISVNPQRGIEETSVRLFAVGSDIRVPLLRWSEWLAAPTKVTPHLQTLEVECLATLLPRLRERYPSAHDVVDAIESA